MVSGLRLRFWLEAAFGSLSGLLFVLTLITREWIELLFRLDPDAGSGSAEWAVLALSAGAGLALLAVASLEWRGRERAVA